MEGRTLSVTGRGKAGAKPDRIAVDATLTTLKREYPDMMTAAGAKLERLYAALEGAGIPRGDVKTQSYSVDARYESVRTPGGEYAEKFAGYCCRQALTLSFDFDLEKLGAALDAVASCEAEPGLCVRFTVKDTAALRDKAVASAVAEARRNAELIAAAAGERLGELISISAAPCHDAPASPTHFARAVNLSVGKSRAADMNPEDVSADESITAVWALG